MFRIVAWLLRGLGVLYALQLVFLLYWEFVPMKQLELQGVRYEIYRGYGFPLGLFPLVGVFSLTEEPVRLVIINKDGRKEVKDYEHPQDLRKEYPSVWPSSDR